MEFKEVMKQRRRMCDIISACEKCPLCSRNNKRRVTCREFLSRFPEAAEEIIMKWAKENPVKTNADKFKEVFGYGLDMMEISEVTNCCILECGEHKGNCRECAKYNFWDKEYKEPKGTE